MRILIALVVSTLLPFAGVMAQSDVSQQPTFSVPKAENVAGKVCGNHTSNAELEKYHSQDPVTLYYSGRILARLECIEESWVANVCADGLWDPAGNFVSAKILWVDTKSHHNPSEGGAIGLYTRCFEHSHFAIQ